MADIQRQQQATDMIDERVILVAGPGEVLDRFIDTLLERRIGEIYGLFNNSLLRAGPDTTKEDLLQTYWRKR